MYKTNSVRRGAQLNEIFEQNSAILAEIKITITFIQLIKSLFKYNISTTLKQMKSKTSINN